MGAVLNCRPSLSRLFVAAMAALVLFGTFAVSAHADPIPAGEIRMDGLRSRFNVVGGGAVAGEFVVNASRLNFTPVGLGRNGAGSNQFISFCVETTEWIQLNKWYDADLNTQSENTHREVQQETAYLYSQFVRGTLTDYKYFDSGASDSAKVASARALQEIIWYYQDPTGFAARYGSNAFGQNGYFTSGSGAYKALARAWYAEIPQGIAGGGTDLSLVRIINIWENGTGARQDTIVMIPLPAPVWMAGLGLFGIVGGNACRRHGGRSTTAAL